MEIFSEAPSERKFRMLFCTKPEKHWW